MTNSNTSGVFPQEQVSLMQQVSSSMVQVAVYSAFATAMATAMTTMGAAAVTSGAKPTQNVIDDLKRTFGSDLVNKAIKNVGSENVSVLAQEVDRLFVDDLKSKYGAYVADTALQAAPPLETKIVRDVAQALSGQGITPYTPQNVTQEVTTTSRAKSLRKHPPVPYLDKQTGIAYPSRSSLYRAVAGEFGYDPNSTLEAFKLVGENPDRFERMSQAEFDKHTGKRFLRKIDKRKR